MSLLDDVKTKKLDKDATFYADWQSFWAACPLSRSMLVQHTPAGAEYITPELSTAHFQQQFFDPDGFGVVISRDGAPVAGAVYRRISPDTVEQTLRLGERIGRIGLRNRFRKLGITKIRYKIHKQKGSTVEYLRQLEAELDNAVVVTDPGDGYYHYEVTMKESPE